VRAAITGFAESAFYQDTPEPVPLLAAQAPLEQPLNETRLLDRLASLAAPALSECLESSGLDLHRTPLLIGVREPFRDIPGRRIRVEELPRALGALHPDSAVIPEGNAAALRGVARARELLASGRSRACVVGGVDSFLNVDDLRRFEGTYRIKREGIAQGFIPGEGAAFVAVNSPGEAPDRYHWGDVIGVGLATEDPAVSVLGDGQPTGRGLIRALRATLADAAISDSDVGFRVSDTNGEYYRGMETALAFSRIYRSPRERLDLWVPAACTGETGAAAGALMIVLACLGWSKEYAPGPVTMCEASSDSGFRAGCLVRAHGAPASAP
jgi:3-oxoacyl-[acyl-carrier-protein] synthase-1